MDRAGIRYAKSGDFHVAYQVLRDGPIDLLLSPGWVTHLDLGWDIAPLARFLELLASFSRPTASTRTPCPLWNSAWTMCGRCSTPWAATGRRCAKAIPGARYVELPGADHLVWAGDQEAILREVETFLRDQAPAGGPPRPESAELGLTDRELAVLRLVAADRTNEEIAATLYISPKTAGAHGSNILAKLRVERRAAAATMAQRLGLDAP